MPHLLFILSLVLFAAVGCVPGTSDSAAPSAEESVCLPELTLTEVSDTFVLQSSEVSEGAASYRGILRSSLREFNGLVRRQLESQGWQFTANQVATRGDRSQTPRVASRYTCTSDPDKRLSLSIAPVGRSLIYRVLVELE